MLWSIIALFAMMSVWGIVAMLANVLGVSIGGGIPAFKLPGEK